MLQENSTFLREVLSKEGWEAVEKPITPKASLLKEQDEIKKQGTGEVSRPEGNGEEEEEGESTSVYSVRIFTDEQIRALGPNLLCRFLKSLRYV